MVQQPIYHLKRPPGGLGDFKTNPALFAELSRREGTAAEANPIPEIPIKSAMHLIPPGHGAGISLTHDPKAGQNAEQANPW